MYQMTVDKAKEISKARDLSVYEQHELRAYDDWIKVHALSHLESWLIEHGVDTTLSEYIKLMARCHFGSIETDELLTKLGCYPDWLG